MRKSLPLAPLMRLPQRLETFQNGCPHGRGFTSRANELKEAYSLSPVLSPRTTKTLILIALHLPRAILLTDHSWTVLLDVRIRKRAPPISIADDEAPPIQLGIGLVDGPGRREVALRQGLAIVPSVLPMRRALVLRLWEQPSSSFSSSSSEARLAAVPRAAGRQHLTPLSPKRPSQSLRRGPQEETAFDAKSLRVRSVYSR